MAAPYIGRIGGKEEAKSANPRAKSPRDQKVVLFAAALRFVRVVPNVLCPMISRPYNQNLPTDL